MSPEFDVAALVQGAVDLGSPPHVVHRLNELVDDPRASIADIAEVIRTDPSLSARLLRLANSAFYSFPGRVDTVYRALTLIGTKQVRDLAFATLRPDPVSRPADRGCRSGLVLEPRHGLWSGGPGTRDPAP